MSNRRNRKIRDLTRLVHAQARHAGAQARQVDAQARQVDAENTRARIGLEQQQLNDAIARRERYVALLDQQHVHNEIRAFNYLRLLTETPTQFKEGH